MQIPISFLNCFFLMGIVVCRKSLRTVICVSGRISLVYNLLSATLRWYSSCFPFGLMTNLWTLISSLWSVNDPRSIIWETINILMYPIQALCLVLRDQEAKIPVSFSIGLGNPSEFVPSQWYSSAIMPYIAIWQFHSNAALLGGGLLSGANKPWR